MAVDPLYSPEAMLCAALLDQPSQYEEVRWLEPDNFDNPENRDLFKAIRYVMDREKPTDGPTLTNMVRHLLGKYSRGAAMMRLVSLTGAYPAVGVLAPSYARAIFEARKHEALAAFATRVTQVVTGDRTVEEKVDLLRSFMEEALVVADRDSGWQPVTGLSSVEEFVATDNPEYEWVIPGLLERQGRMMVIAPEKAGKTVLTRQIALACAVGRHPLHPQQGIPRMRTLLVDLENPAGIVRRDFRRQMDQMDGLFATPDGHAHILHRPAGIHLGNPRDVTMLRQVVDMLAIDLVCISPIYKAYDGLDKSWEEQAHGVQQPLDKLREEFNCALLMEHHAPWGGDKGKREIRPIGSSRWARWLDYQVCLTPDEAHPPYRTMWWGATRRDERMLAPLRIRRGAARDEASWVAEWPEGEHGFALAYDAATAG